MIRTISRIWMIFANVTTIAVISILSAFVIVWSLGTDELVFERRGPVQLLTPRIPVGGKVTYIVRTRQNTSCPGEIVTTFTSEATSEVETVRRPVTRQDVGTFRDFTASLDVPPRVGVGKWTVTVAADSRCPLREVVSPIATFEIEVME